MPTWFLCAELIARHTKNFQALSAILSVQSNQIVVAWERMRGEDDHDIQDEKLEYEVHAPDAVNPHSDATLAMRYTAPPFHSKLSPLFIARLSRMHTEQTSIGKLGRDTICGTVTLACESEEQCRTAIQFRA